MAKGLDCGTSYYITATENSIKKQRNVFLTVDGDAFKAVKLKLKASEPEDEQNLKRDAKKYIDTMKKEIPKIEKKL